jgi:hypothetical protein
MPAIEVTAPRYQGEDVAWSGLMPAVEVTAPRHQGEDVAWSGLMPAVEVTAPRHENEDIAWSGMIPVVEVIAERVAELLVDETARHEPKHVQATLVDQVREPDCELDIQCADLKIFGVIPNAVTFSGDYSLPAGDTIDEDVTVTGGNALIDGVISGDLAVMGGTVDVNGTVTGDVAVFGGNLEMNGFIDGDAAVLGGNIRNKGTIDGDLHVIGGTVYLDSASAINGDGWYSRT